jgi:hypothetical protein
MNILFDQGTPAPLRHELHGHDVATAYEKGWAELSNGDLLKAAAADFDAFITTDKNLSYQQNLSDRRLAIMVLPTTSWPKIRANAVLVRNAIKAIRPGDYVELEFP